MTLVSASEASRNFADLLDRAEHGETMVITRGGQRLAVIGPAPISNGGEIREALTGWHERYPDDDPTFETDVVGVRDLLEVDDSWHE